MLWIKIARLKHKDVSVIFSNNYLDSMLKPTSSTQFLFISPPLYSEVIKFFCRAQIFLRNGVHRGNTKRSSNISYQFQKQKYELLGLTSLPIIKKIALFELRVMFFFRLKSTRLFATHSVNVANRNSPPYT